MNEINPINESKKAHSVIKMGAEMVGGMASTAIGLITMGPVGAIFLGGLGSGISKMLVDVTERQLSKRELTRIGATTAVAIIKINENIESGKEIRKDDFFTSSNYQRSSAEEIFEGALIKAKNEHEERKVRLLGNIFANAAFMHKVSVGEVNHILKMIDNLTYRQLCTLSLIFRKKPLGIKLEDIDYGEFGNEKYLSFLSPTSISLRQEIYQMYQLGLVNMNDTALLSWEYITPEKLELTELGNRCYEIMGLYEISDNEIKSMARVLSPK